MSVAGFTSTGSKRPNLLFGADAQGAPQQMVRAAGCMVHATDGREYLDLVMALGAVALGYANPAVNRAVNDAIERGTIGPLAPHDESLLAEELHALIPVLEQVRFLKTGAEAMAAAVRIARTHTGRDMVLGCGYHGWLDWCSSAAGVPASSRSLFATVPFNDPEQTRAAIRAHGDRLACVAVEPVIECAPSPDWLAVLREETARVGALLVFDEVKTAFRIAIGGATELWSVAPDLMVLGKAMANGYPLAVVGGPADIMAAASRTWISSTMATEFVSLAAARATLREMVRHDVPAHLARVGERLLGGMQRIAADNPDRGIRASGVAQMCYLRFDDDATSQSVAAECARRSLLFKRTAYNFVSLAHDDMAVERALGIIAEAIAAC